MCLLFFCKICKLLFFISWCLLFDILFAAAGGNNLYRFKKKKRTQHFCWSDMSSHCNCGKANRLKLLLPVTAAEISIHNKVVYSSVKIFFPVQQSTISEQKTINYFYLYLNYSSICRVFRSLKHTFIEKKLFNIVAYKYMVKLTLPHALMMSSYIWLMENPLFDARGAFPFSSSSCMHHHVTPVHTNGHPVLLKCNSMLHPCP